MSNKIAIKADFALAQILPYYVDRTLCSYASAGCYYKIGSKMCVAGKNMLPEVLKVYGNVITGILSIINKLGGQDNVFKPYAANILTDLEWGYLQDVHDSIALERDLIPSLKQLDLFSLEELAVAAENFKKQQNNMP